MIIPIAPSPPSPMLSPSAFSLESQTHVYIRSACPSPLKFLISSRRLYQPLHFPQFAACRTASSCTVSQQHLHGLNREYRLQQPWCNLRQGMQMLQHRRINRYRLHHHRRPTRCGIRVKLPKKRILSNGSEGRTTNGPNKSQKTNTMCGGSEWNTCVATACLPTISMGGAVTH